jgi:hypothetical protein
MEKKHSHEATTHTHTNQTLAMAIYQVFVTSMDAFIVSSFYLQPYPAEP